MRIEIGIVSIVFDPVRMPRGLPSPKFILRSGLLRRMDGSYPPYTLGRRDAQAGLPRE
ncbi:MAG: hypothetical protein MUP49_00020 [Dehalococcoidia bacterium]|nr:hypothetical protein [Dehalococcoidia bacterium]